MTAVVTEIDAVVCEVRIAARPETIFPYLTDPVKFIRWMGTSATLDARAGGAFDVQVTPDAHALGSFVEVSPPDRVVFTFGWEGENPVPPGSSTVEITLQRETADFTLVRLVHRGIADAQQRAQHTQGWTHFLERLDVVGRGQDPGPDPWAQPAPAQAAS